MLVDERTAGSPLLATADQWGASPFPLRRMSPHGVSEQARNLVDGIITVHRTLPARVSTDDPRSPVSEPPTRVSARYSRAQWRAGLDRRRSDISDLAGISGEVAEVDQRAAELDRRINELLKLASSAAP